MEEYHHCGSLHETKDFIWVSCGCFILAKRITKLLVTLKDVTKVKLTANAHAAHASPKMTVPHHGQHQGG